MEIKDSKLRKAFANNSLTNIKLSKTQLHKIGKLGAFLGRIVGPLLKTGLPWIGNVLKPWAKCVLIPLGLTAAAALDATIPNKMFGSGFTILIISNEEIEDIKNIVKSLEVSGLLLKGVSKTIKNEVQEQKGGFQRMLLGFLGSSLLGHLWTGKGTTTVGEGKIKADKNF